MVNSRSVVRSSIVDLLCFAERPLGASLNARPALERAKVSQNSCDGVSASSAMTLPAARTASVRRPKRSHSVGPEKMFASSPRYVGAPDDVLAGDAGFGLLSFDSRRLHNIYA